MAEGSVQDVLKGKATWAVVLADCIDALRLLPDQCGVVYTDVPYNAKKAIANDDMPWEEYLPWLDVRIEAFRRVGRLAFSFFGHRHLLRFVRDTTQPPSDLLHWHKSFMLHDRILAHSPFLAHGEHILYWGPMDHKVAGKLGYDSFAANAMWPHERHEQGIGQFPTPKPMPLLLQTIPHWSRPGELIIDPFCGSGTHPTAALRLGHPVIAIDIDPRWVELTRARLRAEETHSSLGAESRGQAALF